MTGTIKTLLRPFETGDLAVPQPGTRWLFVNAAPIIQAGRFFSGVDLVCLQPFRPDYLDLQQAGFSVVADWTDTSGKGGFDGALVLLGKHRRLNEARIARANALVAAGGPVVIAGDKSLGAQSARKWVANQIGIDGSLSKHHALAFWFAADPAAFGDTALEKTHPAQGFTASPGMFSADHIDPGSALLADGFDKRITGAVADFGAGWGYLGGALLDNAAPTHLDLVEADKPSLDAAVSNLMPRAGSVLVEGHWLDIAREALPQSYDWIVMNPPFHTGRKGEPDLGQRFIFAAARALKPQGRLLAVANRHLPYERALGDAFADVKTLTETPRFKVIEATGPKMRRRNDGL